MKPLIENNNVDLMDQMSDKTTLQLDFNGATIAHEVYSEMGGTLSPKTPIVGYYPNPDIINQD